MDGSSRRPIPAFAAHGLELEYMIVDAATLDVRPLAPQLLQAMAGGPACDVDFGRTGWSNEIVQHVVELKNPQPDTDLASLRAAFAGEIARANGLLARHGCRLMPGGMHPWMDPARDTVLWEHGDGSAIYRLYDRLFDCRRHGFANLQSMHVNLPFAGDAQFAALHAAIRCVLPLVPALAAASPIADGEPKPELDHRLAVYRTNQQRVPSIAGAVVPEHVGSEREYRQRILAPMYADIAALDPGRRLAHEWLNSRGAIARFDRSAIEIRLADAQECPRADVAIAAAITLAVRTLYDETFAPRTALELDTDRLAVVLEATTRDGEAATLDDDDYLALFGVRARSAVAGTLWTRMLERGRDHDWCRDEWHTLLAHGTLARRVLRAVGPGASRERLRDVYGRLCECLAADRMFVP